MRPLSLAVIVRCACLALTLGAQTPATAPASSTPQATFRAGVDVVQVDVTVLDRDRRPVRGLAAADFTVLEDGKPQPVIAFTPIEVPAPVMPTAPWMRDVAADVVSNAIDTRRLVMIVIDDASAKPDFGAPITAKAIALQVIDSLGPADLASVAFTFRGRAQNFTTDRAALRAAVDTFSPKLSDSAGPPLVCTINIEGCTVPLLRKVGDALLGAPPGRKTLIYISPGGLPRMEADQPDLFGTLTPVAEMFRSLQRANVTVYSFDPDGLKVGTDPGTSGIQWLAENTGGRAIINTNAPQARVADVLTESGFYYLLGFQAINSKKDGRFRKISVRVNRPGTEVRTRNGYYAPTAARPSKKAPPPPIDAAIARALPTGDLPLRLTTAAFASRTGGTPELALVVGVDESMDQGVSAAAPNGPAIRRRVGLIATAFDENWRSRGAATSTVELTVQPGARELHYELVSKLPLRPGRYEVRFAAESDGRTGSVFTTVEVPDFAKAPLSLSGIVLERGSTLPVVPRDGLINLIPIIPTAVRDFSRGDKVSTLVRVYQGGRAAVVSVRVSARIVDDTDRPVFNQVTALAPDQFGTRRNADHQIALPLATFTPGQYLLTIEATAGPHGITRNLRFTIR